MIDTFPSISSHELKGFPIAVFLSVEK